nr:hypothetical protein [Rhodobium orientis]
MRATMRLVVGIRLPRFKCRLGIAWSSPTKTPSPTIRITTTLAVTAMGTDAPAADAPNAAVADDRRSGDEPVLRVGHFQRAALAQHRPVNALRPGYRSGRKVSSCAGT